MNTPGWKHAVQVLQCGHKIPTQKSMRMFQISKGELTVCPEGCGKQLTKQVESIKWETEE